MKEKKIFLRCIRTVSESQSPNQSAQTPGRMGNFLGRHDCCRKENVQMDCSEFASEGGELFFT